MANIKSQIKRNRQNQKRRMRNRAIRSELRTRSRAVLIDAKAGQLDDKALAAAMSRIDTAAAKGIIHGNTASRQKSRLQKRLNGLES